MYCLGVQAVGAEHQWIAGCRASVDAWRLYGSCLELKARTCRSRLNPKSQTLYRNALDPTVPSSPGFTATP